MSDLLAQLRQLGLTSLAPDSSSPNVRWAFEAGASLVDGDGIFLQNDVRLGLGNRPSTDAVLHPSAQSSNLVESLKQTRALWVGVGLDALVSHNVPDRPAWLAILGSTGAEFIGAFPLPSITTGG